MMTELKRVENVATMYLGRQEILRRTFYLAEERPSSSKPLQAPTADTDDDDNGNRWILPVTLSVAGVIICVVVGFVVYRRFKCCGLRGRKRNKLRLARPLTIVRSSTRKSFSSTSGESDPFRKYDLVMDDSLVEKVTNRDFLSEFRALKERDPRDVPITVALQSCNMLKNRFSNVLPYDRNRVILEHSEENSEDDYINASFLSGFHSQKEFICTQGPRKNTTTDFWRMVWELEVETIVMLSRCYEHGSEKCFPYWPVAADTPIFAGPLQVILGESKLFEMKESGTPHTHNWLVSQLELQNEETNESRQVMHMAFLSWPDFGVVHPPLALLSFIKATRTLTSEEQVPARKPVVVHCSAGIGRTGVYLTVDYLMQQVDAMRQEEKHGVTVNVFQLVGKMREERMGMVQTEEQYRLIYDCALKVAQEDTEIPVATIVKEEELGEVELVEFGLRLSSARRLLE